MLPTPTPFIRRTEPCLIGFVPGWSVLCLPCGFSFVRLRCSTALSDFTYQPPSFDTWAWHVVCSRDFMIQGGDITRGDGTGGLSIWKRHFKGKLPGSSSESHQSNTLLCTTVLQSTRQDAKGDCLPFASLWTALRTSTVNDQLSVQMRTSKSSMTVLAASPWQMPARTQMAASSS